MRPTTAPTEPCMVAPMLRPTARSLIAQALESLHAFVGLLAVGSIPGTVLGLIPWWLCGALWGVALLGVLLDPLSRT